MAKKRYSYKFKKSKKYEFKKSLNYEKGKVNLEFVVAVKNNDQGSAGQGFKFFDIDMASTTESPLNVRQLLSASPEFAIYQKMYAYYRVNGILIESVPSACNASTINYKAPVQIQTKFVNTVTYNNALILNPFNYCKQYIKSYLTDYLSFGDNSDHNNLGIISLLVQPTTVTQGYAPIFHLRISIYLSFKKNINV